MAGKADRRARGHEPGVAALGRRAWLAALLGSTALASMPDAALAACANTGGANWLCSGANVAGQQVLGNDAAVTTANGFSVDAGADPAALDITGRGAISYQDGFASSLTGRDHGLYIKATDDNGATPGSITVNTGGEILGYDRGVVTENFGHGATDLTLTGNVWGLGTTGILATNYATATNLTVMTGDVVGVSFGILAMNHGTGATSVTANGTVAGQVGIQGNNQHAATNLTIAAADVIGGDYGI